MDYEKCFESCPAIREILDDVQPDEYEKPMNAAHLLINFCHTGPATLYKNGEATTICPPSEQRKTLNTPEKETPPKPQKKYGQQLWD